MATKAKPASKAKAACKGKCAAKPAAKKAAPVVKKIPTAKTAFTKTEILNTLATATELSRKEVASVLEALSGVIDAHVRKTSVGFITIPGLMKIQVVNKPAQKARKGINPFTKEEMTFKAKPASRAVKIRPLKKLKEMAA